VTDPQVSFIVLCYNHERYISDCLRSILEQDGEIPFEVIVIDDASPDGSAGVISSFTDRRLRVIRHEQNRGHAASINEALALARAPLVARIDGDDRYRPSFLRTAVNALQAHPSAGLFYSDAAMIGEDGDQRADRMDTVHAGRDHCGSEFIPLLSFNFICAPTIMARAECWRSVPPVPDHLAFHDWYFTLLIARKFDFYYSSDVLAEYRVHDGNLHSLISRNGREETSIRWLLDLVYSVPETSAEVEAAKQAARRHIYARHALTLAEKYFFFERYADARRCYLAALRAPSVYSVGAARRALGSVAPRLYAGAKRRLTHKSL
jgi:glycosyltransferase involved in cell wall biosynthesis